MTYKNLFCAYEAGSTVASEGECPVVVTMPTPSPYEYEPVCGDDGVTYKHLLCAYEAGATVAFEGECPVIVAMPTTSPSPTGKPTELPTVNFEAYPSGDFAYPTDIPGDSVLGDMGTPSSASTAVIGTTTVLAVSAFIFVAV